jgi:hypothetical protein
MPILITQEAEIRRVTVPSQPSKTVRPCVKIPSIRKSWKSGSSGRVTV